MPMHFNGNILAAVDVETTGLTLPMTGAKEPHDMIQICVMPVGFNYEPSREFMPFHLLLQPKRPENADNEAAKITRNLLIRAMTDGMEPWTAVERFGEWFGKLRLRPGKKIIVLGCNYANFDKYFIMDWLGGPLSYEEYFRNDIRDVQTIANYLNDAAGFFCEQVPFPKWNLKYLASCLQIPHPTDQAHDALQDCVTTIEVYKRLLRHRDYADPGPSRNRVDSDADADKVKDTKENQNS